MRYSRCTGCSGCTHMRWGWLIPVFGGWWQGYHCLRMITFDRIGPPAKVSHWRANWLVPQTPREGRIEPATLSTEWGKETLKRSKTEEENFGEEKCWNRISCCWLRSIWNKAPQVSPPQILQSTLPCPLSLLWERTLWRSFKKRKREQQTSGSHKL